MGQILCVKKVPFRKSGHIYGFKEFCYILDLIFELPSHIDRAMRGCSRIIATYVRNLHDLNFEFRLT